MNRVESAAMTPVSTQVDVGEDLAFQHRWWRFERLVWAFFVVILLADMLGAFGKGPLAYETKGTPDGQLRVSYERIERTGTPSMLTLFLDGSAIKGGKVTLFVSDTIIGKLGAQRVVPQPQSSVVGRGGVTYEFPAASGPIAIRLELQPSGAGSVPFRVEVPAVGAISGRILVFP